MELVKKVTINAPASKVWEAITDPKKLQEWLPMPNNIKPVPGTEFEFDASGMEKKGDWDEIIRCRVKDAVLNKRLSYSWASQLIKGETLVTFELEEKNGVTELTLTHSGWENLPENQETWRDGHSNGWGQFLGNLVKMYE